MGRCLSADIVFGLQLGAPEEGTLDERLHQLFKELEDDETIDDAPEYVILARAYGWDPASDDSAYSFVEEHCPVELAWHGTEHYQQWFLAVRDLNPHNLCPMRAYIGDAERLNIEELNKLSPKETEYASIIRDACDRLGLKYTTPTFWLQITEA